VPEATMAQRISRAKQSIKTSGVPFQQPTEAERAERLGAVMHVLYLIFSEGYTASSGPELARTDLSGEAIRLARMLYRLEPGDAELHADLAALFLALDRGAEAQRELLEVRRLTMPNVGGYFTLGWALYGFREYGQAVDYLQRSVALDETFSNSRFALGWVLMDMGRYPEALSEVKHSYLEAKHDPEFLCIHAQLLALTGQHEAAFKIADQLQPSSPTTWYISPYHNARLLFTLGKDTAAWEYLKQAVEERSSRLLTLPSDVFWDPYRQDARFQAVLKRIGLPAISSRSRAKSPGKNLLPK